MTKLVRIALSAPILVYLCGYLLDTVLHLLGLVNRASPSLDLELRRVDFLVYGTRSVARHLGHERGGDLGNSLHLPQVVVNVPE